MDKISPALDGNQAKYVINNDIHSTEAGHKKVAEIGLQALNLKIQD